MLHLQFRVTIFTVLLISSSAIFNNVLAQDTMPDTTNAGAFLDRLYRANKDSLEVPSYRKTGIQRSKEALDTATVYRKWMPDRYADAYEVYAVYTYYYGRRDEQGQKYSYQRRSSEAEMMFDSLIVMRDTLRKKHNDKERNLKYAVALYQKSRTLFNKGRYKQCDQLILQTLQIFKENGDTSSLRYGKILNGYGQLLMNMQQAAEGEKKFRAALDIFARANERRQYAVILVDWAESCSQQQKLDIAEKGFIRARYILDSISKSNPPVIYESMYFGAGINLSKLYLKRKEYDKSIALLDEIIHFNQDTLGTVYKAAINHRAGIAFEKRKYDEARKYYLKAISLEKKTYGNVLHPAIRQEEFRLAKLNYADKRPGEAEPTIVRLLPRYAADLMNASGYFSESEMMSYHKSFIDEFVISSSFAWDYPSDNMSASQYDLLLTTKTAILDNNLKLRAAVKRGGKDAEAQWRHWADLKKKVENAVINQQPTKNLEDSISYLEKQFTGWKKPNDELKTVTWQDVKKALNPGEVAIEFLTFFYRNPFVTDSVLYAALILRKEYDYPVFEKLFEQRQLDSLFKILVDTVPPTFTTFYIGTTNKNTLDNLIWTNKLSKHIKPGETVYFAADGDLTRINPAAISMGKTGKRLWDYCKWVNISSTRELVIRDRGANNTYPQAGDYALIYGGVDYGVLPDSLTKRRAAMGCNFLYGTQVEAIQLDSLCESLQINGTLLLGPSATEPSLRNITAAKNNHSPWLLHIGTHGYYYKQSKAKSKSVKETEPFFTGEADPMWRTGVKLANACQNWYGAGPGAEDGILSAYEAAQLDLSQTYVTVVTACVSGRGENRGFEGLFGLQRAFRVAGSKYLILSLWNTDDPAAVYFVGRFYYYLLERREEIHQAFYSAQMDQKVKYKEPYYWANFVLVGPPR